MDPLDQTLEAARAAGFLGPGEVAVQRRHAEGFARLVAAALRELGHGSGRVLDLGSGGGLPGLVVAAEVPESRLTLLDANRRRTEFLERAVVDLGLSDRTEVLMGRAEVLGRQEGQRGTYDVVVARSFGVPANLAECAAPFLTQGGWLVVSEPPDSAEAAEQPRWPGTPLAQLGLEPTERVAEEFTYQVLTQVAPCPERFPRRDGVPAKRPLF